MHEREPDYYAILNLPPGSSFAEVQEQYRRLVKIFHPDRHAGDAWCEAQLKILNEAHLVLGDPVRKLAYDERRAKRKREDISFDEAFEAATSEDSAESLSTHAAWSFSAQESSRQQQSDSPFFVTDQIGVSQSNTTWNTMSSGSGFDSSNARYPERRSHAFHYAVAAAILFAAMFLATYFSDRSYRLSPGAPPGTAAIGASHNSPQARSDVAVTAKPQSEAITAEEMAKADALRRERNIEEHKRALPYWVRFNNAVPKAQQEILLAEQKLAAMQAVDRASHAEPLRPSSLRSRQEARLYSDTEALRGKLVAMGNTFDDIHYESDPDAEAASLKSLDRQILSIEKNEDPLFVDIDWLKHNPPAAIER